LGSKLTGHRPWIAKSCFDPQGFAYTKSKHKTMNNAAAGGGIAIHFPDKQTLSIDFCSLSIDVLSQKNTLCGNS